MDSEQFVLNLINGAINKEQYNLYHFQGMLDQNGIIRFVSKQHKTTTGYEPSEMIGTQLIDRINPIDIPYIREQYDKMLLTKKPVESKYEVKNKDGLYFVVRSLALPQFDVDDEYCGVVLLSRKRIVSINEFRKTRVMSDLRYAM
jgi:PAS domain S-box-containing protein